MQRAASSCSVQLPSRRLHTKDIRVEPAQPRGPRRPPGFPVATGTAPVQSCDGFGMDTGKVCYPCACSALPDTSLDLCSIARMLKASVMFSHAAPSLRPSIDERKLSNSEALSEFVLRGLGFQRSLATVYDSSRTPTLSFSKASGGSSIHPHSSLPPTPICLRYVAHSRGPADTAPRSIVGISTGFFLEQTGPVSIRVRAVSGTMPVEVTPCRAIICLDACTTGSASASCDVHGYHLNSPAGVSLLAVEV
ncbi:hypothetical protein K438DRAFT_1962210 [Mycena galopus ATCC 62051]|nr:hypothetical protein K438DRAFT_1962210 [Mycena galopus ATCC 62051]